MENRFQTKMSPAELRIAEQDVQRILWESNWEPISAVQTPTPKRQAISREEPFSRPSNKYDKRREKKAQERARVERMFPYLSPPGPDARSARRSWNTSNRMSLYNRA